MDQATFEADCKTRLAADLRAGRIAEEKDRAWDEHYAALDAKRRERAEVSERRYSCPRGEFR